MNKGFYNNQFQKTRKELHEEASQLKKDYDAGLVEKYYFELRIREILRDEITAYLEASE